MLVVERDGGGTDRVLSVLASVRLCIRNGSRFFQAISTRDSPRHTGTTARSHAIVWALPNIHCEGVLRPIACGAPGREKMAKKVFLKQHESLHHLGRKDEPIAKRLRSSYGSSRSQGHGSVPPAELHSSPSPPLLTPEASTGLTPHWLTPTAWNEFVLLKSLSQSLYGLSEEEHDGLKRTHPDMWHQTFRVASRHRTHHGLSADHLDEVRAVEVMPPAEVDEMRQLMHDQATLHFWRKTSVGASHRSHASTYVRSMQHPSFLPKIE